MSVAGSLVKIPSLLGTPALDSLPGYFAAAAVGLPEGAAVAGLGHLATAASAGFPLTMPVHLLVALTMSGAASVFGLAARRRGAVVAVLAGVAVNGLLAPAALALLPGFGRGFLVAAAPSLVVASAINTGLAALLYASYRRRPWF
jgi:hypothetical protein